MQGASHLARSCRLKPVVPWRQALAHKRAVLCNGQPLRLQGNAVAVHCIRIISMLKQLSLLSPPERRGTENKGCAPVMKQRTAFSGDASTLCSTCASTLTLNSSAHGVGTLQCLQLAYVSACLCSCCKHPPPKAGPDRPHMLRVSAAPHTERSGRVRATQGRAGHGRRSLQRDTRTRMGDQQISRFKYRPAPRQGMRQRCNWARVCPPVYIHEREERAVQVLAARALGTAQHCSTRHCTTLQHSALHNTLHSIIYITVRD